MNSRDIERIDTLRLSDKDKAKLLLAIDAASGQPAESEHRRLRVAWLEQEITLTLFGETGTAVRTAVMARNLSRWGIGLVHGRYVYPGTRCEVEIPALDGQWHSRAGRVLLALDEAVADIESIKHAANGLLVILNRVKLR